jgi:hypothetical protein
MEWLELKYSGWGHVSLHVTVGLQQYRLMLAILTFEYPCFTCYSSRALPLDAQNRLARIQDSL